MDIRVLRYFIAVATQENISFAANALHLSQPTLSRQLNNLEEELGTTFICARKSKNHFNRRRYVLLDRAKEIVDLIETEANFNQKSEIISGEIHIGAGETEAMQFIAQTIKSCCPSLTLNFIYIAATLMTLQQN